MAFQELAENIPYSILSNGSTVVIQETAALTAIDVNKAAADSSYLDINLEAAKEIARQLRLRNMGGAIMIDFLRLNKKADKDKLLKRCTYYGF